MGTQSGVVEMQKIINQSPIDTLWVYWESDVTMIENSSTFTDTFSETFFLAENASDVIIVRSHDQLFSGNSASLVLGPTSSPIPIGTYSVGEFDLVVTKTGLIDHVVLSGTSSYAGVVPREWESDVPRNNTVVFEWIADVTNLVPFYDDNDICKVGCDYANLTYRYPELR